MYYTHFNKFWTPPTGYPDQYLRNSNGLGPMAVRVYKFVTNPSEGVANTDFQTPISLTMVGLIAILLIFEQ